MVWKKRKKEQNPKSRFSFIEQLRKNGLSNDKFEIMLNNLRLEDIIAIKLELSCRNAAHHLYGVPIWASVSRIVKQSIFNFARSVNATSTEVCAFLGINLKTYYDLEKKFNEGIKNAQENSSN